MAFKPLTPKQLRNLAFGLQSKFRSKAMKEEDLHIQKEGVESYIIYKGRTSNEVLARLYYTKCMIYKGTLREILKKHEIIKGKLREEYFTLA